MFGNCGGNPERDFSSASRCKMFQENKVVSINCSMLLYFYLFAYLSFIYIYYTYIHISVIYLNNFFWLYIQLKKLLLLLLQNSIIILSHILRAVNVIFSENVVVQDEVHSWDQTY